MEKAFQLPAWLRPAVVYSGPCGYVLPQKSKMCFQISWAREITVPKMWNLVALHAWWSNLASWQRIICDPLRPLRQESSKWNGVRKALANLCSTLPAPKKMLSKKLQASIGVKGPIFCDRIFRSHQFQDWHGCLVIHFCDHTNSKIEIDVRWLRWCTVGITSIQRLTRMFFNALLQSHQFNDWNDVRWLRWCTVWIISIQRLKWMFGEIQNQWPLCPCQCAASASSPPARTLPLCPSWILGARWVQRWSKVIDRLPSFFFASTGSNHRRSWVSLTQSLEI